MLVEVYCTCKCEREESHRIRTLLIHLIKAVVELRVEVFARVVFNADRCTREMLQIVIQFDEEHAVIGIGVAYLLLDLRCPAW